MPTLLLMLDGCLLDGDNFLHAVGEITGRTLSLGGCTHFYTASQQQFETASELKPLGQANQYILLLA